MMKSRVGLLLALGGVVGCKSGEVTAPGNADIVAKVNGRFITQGELDLRMRAGNHAVTSESTPETRRAILDSMIGQELLAQRALELGMDKDPRFQEQEKRREAQLNEFRRRELAEAFLDHELHAKTQVTEADALRYYEANTARIRTEVCVFQILKKGRAEIDAVAAELARGKSFEEVAAAQFPPMPGGQKPWELPCLSWKQVPSPWWSALEGLQPGQTSGIIAGPGDRFWILKLKERRDNTAMTLELAKPAILESLKNASLEEKRAQVEKELRQSARVEIP